MPRRDGRCRAPGGLVAAAIVRQEIAALVDPVRARVMALPAELAPALAGMCDLHMCQTLLADAVIELLTDLSATEVRDCADGAVTLE